MPSQTDLDSIDPATDGLVQTIIGVLDPAQRLALAAELSLPVKDLDAADLAERLGLEDVGVDRLLGYLTEGHQILVKVVDIFGNDTSHLVRWEAP